MRLFSRLKESVPKAKLLATLQLTLRGVPFIYYGEEIGIPNVNIKPKKSKDPIGQKFSWLPFSQIKSLGFAITRDGCRTPMHWNNKKNAGFSKAREDELWLPISQTHRKRNAINEEKNLNSLFHCYKNLLTTRKKYSCLQVGTLELLELQNLDEKILSYKRLTSKEELAIFLNFSHSEESIKMPIKNMSRIFSTKHLESHQNEKKTAITLLPYEGVIYKIR
jgi:alpha-glucosidase